MLLVMRTSARVGIRAALATMAGCMSALLCMMSLSAAGLGALLQAFPTVFEGLRLGGAAYLAYLGMQCWRSPVTADPDSGPVQVVAREPGWALYRQGALVAASNPKAILFAAAFFPQFMATTGPRFSQFVVLLLTFSVIEVSWYLVYALSGRRLSRYLQRVTVRRTFNRVTGSAFIGFGALMTIAR